MRNNVMCIILTLITITIFTPTKINAQIADCYIITDQVSSVIIQIEHIDDLVLKQIQSTTIYTEDDYFFNKDLKRKLVLVNDSYQNIDGLDYKIDISKHYFIETIAIDYRRSTRESYLSSGLLLYKNEKNNTPVSLVDMQTYLTKLGATCSYII